MAPHSSTLAWKIPWTEEPGRPQSMGSLRVGHDWATSLSLFTFMHWRRKWQPTPVFLPGESQGWRSLVGCRLWGRRVGHDWSNLAAAAATPTVPSMNPCPHNGGEGSLTDGKKLSTSKNKFKKVLTACSMGHNRIIWWEGHSQGRKPDFRKGLHSCQCLALSA